MNFRAPAFASVFIGLAAVPGYGQQATPSATPIELKLERIAKLAALDSLKTPGDKPFESADGHFRIDLPQTIVSYQPSQIFQQNTKPRFGTIEWNLEEAEVIIRFGMLPEGTATLASEADRERIMASILDGRITVAGARRIYEKNLTQGSLPAREVRAIGKDQTVLARVILAGDDYYVLAASLRQVKDAETLVKKAFDSFAPLK
jgi:hypothetical protein